MLLFRPVCAFNRDSCLKPREGKWSKLIFCGQKAEAMLHSEERNTKNFVFWEMAMYKMKSPDKISYEPKKEDSERENKIDREIVRRVIVDIEKNPKILIAGEELEKRLARIRKN